MSDLEKELRRFNWGAAYLGFIWSIIHSCFKKWLGHSLLAGLILSIICYGITFSIFSLLIKSNPTGAIYSVLGFVLAPFLVYIGVFLYVGKKGTKWAWDADERKDIEAFKQAQKKWNIVAIVLFSITLLAYGLQIAALLMLGSTPIKKTEEKIINASNCQILADVLPNAIKSVPKEGEWVELLATELEKNEKIMYSYGSNYTNEISVMIDGENLENYRMNIVRTQPCSLSEANCFVSVPTKEPETACRFYFDDNGKVSMSKFTQKFLNTK